MPVLVDRLREIQKGVADGTFVLLKGSHEADHEFCAMEAAAWLAGEKHTDHPRCVAPTIAAFLRTWNDLCPDVERQRLVPYLRQVIDTGPESLAFARARAFLCADWAVRIFATEALHSAHLDNYAQKLAELPMITNKETALEAVEAAAWAAAAARAAAAAVEAVEAVEAAAMAAAWAAEAAAWAAAAAAWAAAGTHIGTQVLGLLDALLEVPALQHDATQHGFTS